MAAKAPEHDRKGQYGEEKAIGRRGPIAPNSQAASWRLTDQKVTA